MDDINQQAFLIEFKKKMMSPFFVSVLAAVGLHYFYLGKWLLGILFYVTSGGFIIWWLVDQFRIRGMVREYNQTVAISVLKDIQILM